jgi:hypothetical protein
MRQTRRLLK